MPPKLGRVGTASSMSSMPTLSETPTEPSPAAAERYAPESVGSPGATARALPGETSPDGLPRASSGASDAPSGAPDDIVRHSATHALVQHATMVGDATAVLPIISTLSFGYSVAGLLEQHRDEHKSALAQLLLALSAVLALYTTTFSVLEAYYIKMLGSADVFAEYVNAMPSLTVADDRDALGRAVNELVEQSETRRHLARNALWLSVVLLLAACGVQSVSVTGVSVLTVALVAVLLVGIVAVPSTVYFFRSRYTPVLEAYHKGHAPPAGVLDAHAGVSQRGALERHRSVQRLQSDWSTRWRESHGHLSGLEPPRPARDAHHEL